MADTKSLYIRERGFRRLMEDLEQSKIAEKYSAFKPVINAIMSRLNKFQTISLSKGEGTRADLKKVYRRSLAQTAHKTSCGVYAYAQITGNNAIKNAVRYSFSDFYRPVEATIIGRVKQILNATKKVKNPEQFGLTKDLIETLRLTFNNFSEYKNVPQITIKKHAQAMRHADQLLNECLHIIQTQLDPLVTAVSHSEEQLERIYFLNRRVKKVSGRKRKYIKKQKPVVEENKMVLPVLNKEQSESITLAFAE